MQSLVSGWHLQPGKTYRRERTEEYRGIVNRAVAGNRDLPEDAKAYRYLFVGGLLTENYGAAYMKACESGFFVFDPSPHPTLLQDQLGALRAARLGRHQDLH